MIEISQETVVLKNNLSLQQAQWAALHEDWRLVHQWLQQTLPYLSQSIDACLIRDWLSLALEVLAEGEFQDRWDVAKLYARLATANGFDPSEMTAPLMDWLQDNETDSELRWFAARILGEFQTPEVLASLIQLLHTCDQADLNEIAAIALSGFGPLAIVPLTSLLHSEQTRLLAVKTLAQIRHSATLAPLMWVMQDPDPEIRAIAIEALSSFHDPQISPVLIEGLQDSSTKVRQAAVTGLSFRPDLLPSLDLVSLIKPLLWDVNLEVCCQAAIALGRLGTDAAVTALNESLQATFAPDQLRIEAIRSLGWIGSPIALQYLTQFFSLAFDQNPVTPVVYQEAITALGRFESLSLQQSAFRFVTQLLNSNHRAIQPTANKQAIALMLGQSGQQEAVDLLLQLLADQNPGVRFHAIAALKKIDPRLALQRLEAIAQNPNAPENLKAGVAIALQEWHQ